MKIFIYIFFFQIFEINAQLTYKSYFSKEYRSIININDNGIIFSFYTIFTDILKYNFELDDQKITSNNEGDMTSLCFLKNGDNWQIFIIVKNYLYSFSTSNYIGFYKINELTNRPSTLISNEFNNNNICSFFIAFINSEKKLEIPRK